MFAPQARLDEYRRQMEQDVSERVNRVRGEGVDRIIKLKKTYGCTRDNDGLTLTQVKVRRGRRSKSLDIDQTPCDHFDKHQFVLRVLLERRSP